MKTYYPWATLMRPTLDEGPGSNLVGTNLKQIESLSWNVPWSLGFSKTGALLLAVFFGRNQLIFPPKQVACRFSLSSPLCGLGQSSKGLGSNLKLLTNRIA